MAQVILIMEDWHNEKSGAYRAYYADSPQAETSVTMVGYCSPYPFFRTIKACAIDARKRDSVSEIYRVFHDSRESKRLNV